MRLRHLVREVDQLAHGLVAARQLVHRALNGDGLGADARQALQRVGVAREVSFAGVAQFHGADELAAQHHRRPGERAAAAPLHGQASASREAALRRAHAEDPGCRGIALDRRPLPGRPRRAINARVQRAGLRGDGEPHRVAISEVHVAARRPGEVAERARHLGRHVVRAVGEQRHEVQADLQHRAQDLALASELREVTGVGAAVGLPLRQESEDVVGEVASMAPWTAVRGDASDVGPPPHRVRAHAQRGRDLSDAQPDGLRPLSDAGHLPPSRVPAHLVASIGTARLKLDQSSHIIPESREVREDAPRWPSA